MKEFRRPTDDFDADSDHFGFACVGPSRTLQSAKAEADINVLVKRFGLGGTSIPVGVRVPSFGDFDGPTDYRECLDKVRLADDSFLRMPAALRARFDNDPSQFVAFCLDPANEAELIQLGLKPKPVEVPAPTEPVVSEP